VIEKEPAGDWRALQDRVASVLAEAGLRAEVGRVISTPRGQFEIDVFATDPAATPETTYLCECKLWKARVPQAEVQAFRMTVAEAGAHVGLFLSSSGFQAGAHAVIRHTNIHLLDWPAFNSMFVERWCETHWVPTFRKAADALASYVEPMNSDASIREARGEPLEPAEAIGLFALDMWSDPFAPMRLLVSGLPVEAVEPAIWARKAHYQRYLPPRAASAESLRELLDALLEFVSGWKADHSRRH
jgi:hypothetical protein